MRNYLVSFGDSNKYAVKFDGNKEEFLNSPKFKDIKDKVIDFIKSKFPMGGFGDAVNFDVEEVDDASGYPELDKNALENLVKSVSEQIKVVLQGKGLNLNAPFDKLGL